jgi:hypothetical protein
MEQMSLNLKPSTLTPQAQRLYERLLESPITNAEMRDELRLLSYTRRLSDIREAIKPDKTIVKRHLGHGVFEYSLKGN